MKRAAAFLWRPPVKDWQARATLAVVLALSATEAEWRVIPDSWWWQGPFIAASLISAYLFMRSDKPVSYLFGRAGKRGAVEPEPAPETRDPLADLEMPTLTDREAIHVTIGSLTALPPAVIEGFLTIALLNCYQEHEGHEGHHMAVKMVGDVPHLTAISMLNDIMSGLVFGGGFTP